MEGSWEIRSVVFFVFFLMFFEQDKIVLLFLIFKKEEGFICEHRSGVFQGHFFGQFLPLCLYILLFLLALSAGATWRNDFEKLSHFLFLINKTK